MALHGMFGGILVEVVVEALAPILGVFATEEREKRDALNVGGNGSAGKVEESGGVVNVLHHFLDVAARFQPLGQVHEQRGRKTLLVHEALVEPSVFAHIEALIGGVDDEGVVEQALGFEVVEQATDIVVEGFHHLGIVAHVALEFVFG